MRSHIRHIGPILLARCPRGDLSAWGEQLYLEEHDCAVRDRAISARRDRAISPLLRGHIGRAMRSHIGHIGSIMCGLQCGLAEPLRDCVVRNLTARPAIGSTAIGPGAAAAEHGPRGRVSSATCSNLSAGLKCRPPARPARSLPHAARLGALLGPRGRKHTVRLFLLLSPDLPSGSGRPGRARREAAAPRGIQVINLINIHD